MKQSVNLLGTLEFRYARMLLSNAYGPDVAEDDVLSGNVGKDAGMRLHIEFWDEDAGEWVLSDDDNLTEFPSKHLSAVSVVDAGSATLGTGDVSVTAGTSTLANGQTLETGTDDQPLYLTAPGKDGSLLMQYDLDAASLPFLKYDWRDDGETDDLKADPGVYGATDNPRALLEFGVYRGSSRIINWQELFINEVP